MDVIIFTWTVVLPIGTIAVIGYYYRKILDMEGKHAREES